MTSFQWKVAATVLLAVIGVLLLQCAVFAAEAALCMRQNFVELGIWAMHWITLGVSIWLGMETARATKRNWVGWIAGIAVLVVLNVGLSWMGFTLPSGEIDDGSDNSYRR